jgi:replicative DNA helicase
MQGVTLVLYNLPEVIRASVVFVVEGEKDVETLRDVGLVATTNVGGAGKFRQSYAKWFEGKTVYILPDNDEPGKKHAQDVKTIIGHGTIIELPVGHKEDITDWFKAGFGKDDLEKLIHDIEEKPKPAVELKTLETLALTYVAQLSGEKLKLYSTGISDLDESLGGGISMGERIVIAARPSHGKTAVSLQMLHAFSLQGLSCLFINEEMQEDKIGQRTIQFVSPIVSQEAWLYNKDDIQVQVANHFIERENIYVESNSFTVQKVVEHIRNYHAKHGVQVVAIDYIQNLDCVGSANTYDKVTQVSKAIATVAKDLGIIAIMICQLNREIEQRRDRNEAKPGAKKQPLKLPKMSDIKESGQIEQDADVVLFCVWPKMFDPSTDPKEYVFSIAKNRNRGIGKAVVYCEFNPDRQSVYDVPVESSANYDHGLSEW